MQYNLAAVLLKMSNLLHLLNSLIIKKKKMKKKCICSKILVKFKGCNLSVFLRFFLSRLRGLFHCHKTIVKGHFMLLEIKLITNLLLVSFSKKDIL